MKKSMFIFAVAIGIIFTACERNEKNELDYDYSLINKIGQQHNDGLDYVMSKINQDQSIRRGMQKINRLDAPVSSKTIATLSFEYVESIPDFAKSETFSVDREKSIETLTTHLDEIRTDLSVENVKSKWIESLNTTYEIVQISHVEKQAISEIQQVFESIYNTNISSSELHEYLQVKINHVATNYNNSLNAENELFTGLLQITSFSNDYWNNVKQQVSVIDEPLIPFEPDPYVVQLDCIGYILAWTSAVYEDSKTEKGVTKDGQWNRIGKGLFGAVGASTLGRYGNKKPWI